MILNKIWMILYVQNYWNINSILIFQRDNYQRYKKRCRALYDCEADNEDELTFEEGDIIIILAEETEDDNWMEGVLETEPDKRGLFPASFVHMLSDWPSALAREIEWKLENPRKCCMENPLIHVERRCVYKKDYIWLEIRLWFMVDGWY